MNLALLDWLIVAAFFVFVGGTALYSRPLVRSVADLYRLDDPAEAADLVKEGKVQYAHLKISEAKRFFTQGVRGKSALNVAKLVSRICGTCSIAPVKRGSTASTSASVAGMKAPCGFFMR